MNFIFYVPFQPFNLVLPLFLLIGFNPAAIAQDYYQLGMKAYKGPDDSAAAAVQYFTRAIELQQQPAKSYMMRAAAEEVQRNFVAATEDLNQSKALDSTYPELYYYYGQFYLRQDLYLLSIHYFDIAIAKDTRQAKFYNARATARYFLYEYDKIIEDESKAIALDSTEDGYFTNRGYALLELKEFNKAVSDLTTSLRIRPSQKGYADRGYTYAQLGRHVEAIADYNGSLRLAAKDGETLYLRGVSYLALGKQQEACRDFNKSAELNYQPAFEKLKTSCGK
jgi:tetratricopeptide (TPR) repeat protein